MVMLAGLAMATIFINIFINPNTFINPFPPPTPIATLDVATLTPSQRSLPGIWTETPETPGVPSATKSNETATVTVTGTRLVLPTGTSTSTPTKTRTPTKFVLTPNRTLTAVAYKTATKTSAVTGDETDPTTPGDPYTTSATTDSTPTWKWTKSTDSGSGMDYYDLSWGGDAHW